jgi:Gluconate 2-dehydrogenase subunit 3
MTRVTRRGAIKTLGAAAAAPLFPLQGPDLDPAALAAIAEVVLPSEANRKDAVAAFVRWIDNYKEGADTDHGYGNTRIRATGPSSAQHYPAQIAALEAAARANHAASFAQAPVPVRRTILEGAIAEARIERLPSRPTGGHIATDLMGHYFASSAAQDLCYRAQIGRDLCRGLAGSERPPARLEGRASRLEARDSRTSLLPPRTSR